MQHDDEDAKYSRTVTMLEELRRSQMERHRQLEAANTALTADNDNLRAQLEAKTTEAADEKAAHTATKASLDTLHEVHEELKIKSLVTEASLADCTFQLNTCRDELQAKTTKADEEKAAHAVTTIVFLDTLQSTLTAQLDTFRVQLRDKTSHTATTVTTLNPAQAAHEAQLANSTPPQLGISCDEHQAHEADDGMPAHTATNASLASQLDACRAELQVLIDTNRAHEATIAELRAEKESAVHLLSLYSEACDWNDRGLLLKMDEVVTVDGIPYTKKECFLKALEIQPGYATIYNKLGVMLTEDETVTINGTPYTKRECFLKALEIQPRFMVPYSNLGVMLTENETVTINGTPYTKNECYLKSLGIDPRHVNAYPDLGVVLSNVIVTVNGSLHQE